MNKSKFLSFSKLRFVVVFVFVVALTLTSCVEGAKKAETKRQIAVTIPPLQGLVERIVGDDFEVVCILPSGSTPENYSPTTRQIASLSDSESVFYLGTIDFEREIVERAENEQNKSRFVNVGEGVELISGSCCAHSHSHDHHAHNHPEGEHHHHGTDPHIWLAPSTLEVIVDNIAREIIRQNPDSVRYVANYEKLKGELVAQKTHFGELLKSAPRSFLIYHPALAYLSKDYGLEQISLENEGKNPTPASLADVVDRVKAEGIEVMLYQQEYPLDVVEPIVDILGVKMVKINPLSRDIIGELNRIAEVLSGSYEQ